MTTCCKVTVIRIYVEITLTVKEGSGFWGFVRGNKILCHIMESRKGSVCVVGDTSGEIL
jgi:hypothetical protein